MKYQIYMCEKCLQCRDPEIYCKFRTSCPIYFISKSSERENASMAQSTSIKEKSDD